MATTSSVHIYSYVKTLCYVCYVATILFPWFFGLVTCQISRGSRLLATENKVWISQNGTFALGFTPLYSNDQLQLGIWYNQIPGERVVVWSANRYAHFTSIKHFSVIMFLLRAMINIYRIKLRQ